MGTERNDGRRRAHVWSGPERPAELVDAIVRAGGSVVEIAEANVIAWSSRHDPPEEIRKYLHPGIEWVQLEEAGIDQWIGKGLIDRDRVWTCARGVYGALTAEHAIALLLAAAKKLPQAARTNRWGPLAGKSLAGSTVGIVGAGAVGREIIGRLAPFGVSTIALTHSGRPVPGADRSVGPPELAELLKESAFVILCLPLTPATRHMIGARELELLGPKGWLINVARGQIVDTRALAAALQKNVIEGACLDVTDPEPLPEAHPLWKFTNVLITPHSANPATEYYPFLARLVHENVKRFIERSDLTGRIDLARGY